MRAIGLNIFGGGFTLGVQQAGIEVIGQWEECDAGKRTWDLNFDDMKIHRPLRHGDWPTQQYRGRAQLVYANPPCAPWSSVNTKNSGQGRFADPRLALSAHSMEAGMALRPEVFVCESVPNAFTIGLSYYNDWARKWMDEGYAVTYYLTDALLHGTPSTRQRFHFIAHRVELGLESPDMRAFMPRTLRGTIGDLEKVSRPEMGHVLSEVAVKSDLLKCFMDTRPGDCVAEVVKAAKEAGEYEGTLFSFLIRRQLWDAPAFTVLYMEAMVHPNGTRWMTLREGLRVCGYPDSFRIHASKEATQAVLPTMGLHLATLAREAIERGQPARPRRAVHVVDQRALGKPYRPGAVRDLLSEL